MKKFIGFVIFLQFIFVFFQIFSKVEEKTMYVCCTPQGLCDQRVFEYKGTCTRACFGHNICLPKTVHVTQHPVTGLHTVSVPPEHSGVVTGVTTEGTHVVRGVKPETVSQSPAGIETREEGTAT